LLLVTLADFEAKVHTTRNKTVWQIVDVRFKRRMADGHFTIEASGAEGKPGMFATAKDAERALAKTARLFARLENDSP
jgi:hypothetical protein